MKPRNPYCFYEDEETYIPQCGDSLIALEARLKQIDEDAKQNAGVLAWETQLELV